MRLLPFTLSPKPRRGKVLDRGTWKCLRRLASPSSCALVVAIAVVLVLFFWPHRPVAPEVLEPGPYRVAGVSPEGILHLENGAEVRLLGIQPAEPTAAAVQEHAGSQPIYLHFDRVRKDRSGRFLAFVYLDDQCLNELLLRQGVARAVRDYPYDEHRKKHFLTLEQEARRAHRGIWGDEAARQEPVSKRGQDP